MKTRNAGQRTRYVVLCWFSWFHIAYHLRQSFKPGEISPELANRIGYDLAMSLTKGNHAFIVCTHVDKHHIAYDFLTVMVPAAAITSLFYFGHKRRNIPISRRYIVYMMVFFFYLSGVFYFTGAGTFFDAKRYGLDLNTRRLNLIPFSDTDIDYTAYGLNIILFIPFGFLLPLIWSCFEKFKNVWLAGGFIFRPD